MLPVFSFFQNSCPRSSKSKLNNYIKKEPEAKLCLRFFSLVQNCNSYPGDLKFSLSPRSKPQLFAGSNNINHHLLLSGKRKTADSFKIYGLANGTEKGAVMPDHTLLTPDDSVVWICPVLRCPKNIDFTHIFCKIFIHCKIHPAGIIPKNQRLHPFLPISDQPDGG